MNGMRVLAILIGLAITAPIIVMNAMGMDIAFWIKKEVVPEEIIVEAAPPPEPPAIIPDPIILPRDRPAVQAMFTTDRLTDARIVKITEVITDAELLQPGEAQPDDRLWPLYAAARAPARLIRYCEDVIATLGTTCDVIHTETRENQDGKREILGHLAYIPAFDTGNPYNMTDGALVQASIDLPHDGDLLPANTAATRKAALEQVIGLCTELRGTYGNCAVAQVSFTVNELWITDLEALPAGTNPQRLAIQADFAIFAEQSRLDETKLKQALQDLTDPA